MGLAETAELAVRINLSGNASTGIDKLTRKVNGLSGATKRIGTGFGQIGAGLGRAGLLVGGAVATGLIGAAKAAIDFEDDFAGVIKTVDEVDLKKAGLSFDDLANSLRKMSTEMPNTVGELVQIAEAAGAMGIAGKDIEDFTRQVAIMASTTNVTAEQGAVALGQMQNVIGLTASEFDNFTASLVALGNTGNSTEASILEIARRSGGAAKLFGIAKEQTLGWAAAAANLGINEELAGTALQNVFIKLLPKYIKGSKDLQLVTGKTGDALKKAFKEDAGGALQDLIKQLAGMSKGDRLGAIQKLFGKGSGITRLINGLADSYKDNLTPSLDGATDAWVEGTAAQVEFEKKNATVRSAIARFKNGIMDAAITLGEGFAPALGRSAEKLSEFLKQDGNRSALKALGEDIGKAIDGIDWAAVLAGARDFVGVMKGALSFALEIVKAVNSLPTQVKAAAAGLLVLNKASGGLLGAGIGNIAGGAAQAAASRLPGVGKLFAQPVFVTNFPLGFGAGGGLPGAAAGAGAAAIAGGAIITAAAAAAVVAVQQDQSNKNTDFSADIRTGLDSSIVGKSQAELRTALAGVNQGITDLSSNPLYALVQGEALDNLRSMKASLESALNSRGLDGAGFRPKDATIPVVTEIGTLRKNMETSTGIVADRVSETKRETARGLAIVDTAVGKATSAALETKRETTRGAALTAATTRTGSASIVGAIYANRPQTFVNVNVNATTVSKSVTINNRYGSSGGSRNQNSSGSGTIGNGGR